MAALTFGHVSYLPELSRRCLSNSTGHMPIMIARFASSVSARRPVRSSCRRTNFSHFSIRKDVLSVSRLCGFKIRPSKCLRRWVEPLDQSSLRCESVLAWRVIGNRMGLGATFHAHESARPRLRWTLGWRSVRSSPLLPPGPQES